MSHSSLKPNSSSHVSAPGHPPDDGSRGVLPRWFQAFLALGWYDTLIHFLFTFVTKTSELLLAAGIIVSTANFLTDGDLMRGHTALSDAWSWAQALAIDSSLGIMFYTAFQALQAREKLKAALFFTLTALLATVAGLITHFDALAHATGLPVTDKGVSGIIPLWVMTMLRAIAVIGVLLASRLKAVSFQRPGHHALQESFAQTQRGGIESSIVQIRGQRQVTLSAEAQRRMLLLFRALRTTQQDDVLIAPSIAFPSGQGSLAQESGGTGQPPRPLRPREEPVQQGSSGMVGAALLEPPEVRLQRAYQELLAAGQRPSGRALALRTHLRRTTCTAWLRQQQQGEEGQQYQPEEQEPSEEERSPRT